MSPTRPIPASSGIPVWRLRMKGTIAWEAPLTTVKDNLRSRMPYRMAVRQPGSMVSTSSTPQERSNLPHYTSNLNMAILSKEEAQKLLLKVLGYSKAEECEVNLNGSEGGNIRYARNAVSTAGEISRMSLVVSSTYGKKTGTATIDEFDDASLEKVVRRAEELAQLAPENPEHMPLLGPQTFPESITYVPATAAITPDIRAEAVGKSIAVSKDAKLQAAGYIENTTSFNAVANSKGLFAYNKDTDVIFTITTRNEEGTGSGYAARGYHD